MGYLKNDFFCHNTKYNESKFIKFSVLICVLGNNKTVKYLSCVILEIQEAKWVDLNKIFTTQDKHVPSMQSGYRKYKFHIKFNKYVSCIIKNKFIEN